MFCVLKNVIKQLTGNVLERLTGNVLERLTGNVLGKNRVLFCNV